MSRDSPEHRNHARDPKFRRPQAQTTQGDTGNPLVFTHFEERADEPLIPYHEKG